MEQIILWFFDLVVQIVNFALDFKIYGDFSLLHFILGFNFLMILFSFYKFGIVEAIPGTINFGFNSHRNAENKKERKYKESYSYYKENRFRTESYRKQYNSEFGGKS